jgi:hypothetical protein
MKNKTVKGVLLGGIITLIFACNTKKEEPAAAVDKEQIKKEIQAKEDEFASVYNSGVLKNIGYYADDATSFFQNRQPLRGKAAIVEFLKSDVMSNPNKISFKTNEVFVSSDGNQVVEFGYFTWLTLPVPLTQKLYEFFEKRNGKYACLGNVRI